MRGLDAYHPAIQVLHAALCRKRYRYKQSTCCYKYSFEHLGGVTCTYICVLHLVFYCCFCNTSLPFTTTFFKVKFMIKSWLMWRLFALIFIFSNVTSDNSYCFALLTSNSTLHSRSILRRVIFRAYESLIPSSPFKSKNCVQGRINNIISAVPFTFSIRIFSYSCGVSGRILSCNIRLAPSRVLFR